MASISSRLPAAAITTSLSVPPASAVVCFCLPRPHHAHTPGVCRPLPRPPCAGYYPPAPEAVLQKTFLFVNPRELCFRILNEAGVFPRSPVSPGLRVSARVWAAAQTSSHFQSRAALRAVFFLRAPAHHGASFTLQRRCGGGLIFLPQRVRIYFRPASTRKQFGFACFFSAAVARYAAASQDFHECVSALRWKFQNF